MSNGQILGRCFICKDYVTNYRYKRAGYTFHPIYIEGRGYCHEGSCYDKWNPPRGKCVYCSELVRKYNGGVFHNKLLHKKCYKSWAKEKEGRIHTIVSLPIQTRPHNIQQQPPKPEEPVYKKIAEPALSVAMSAVLAGAHINPQLYCGITVAKACYSSWKMISQYLKEKQTESLVKDIAQEGLACAQEDVIWTNIKDKIPLAYQSVANSFVSEVVNKISEEEVNLVSQFI